MTKRDLIDLLKDFPDDKEVLIAFDYGDRGHSMVTQKIEEVDILPLQRSPYGPMSKCINMDEEVEVQESDPIVIRG